MARMTAKKAMAARKTWQDRAETWRAKIQVAQIVNVLNDHINGKKELKPTQVKAAQVLLDRVMPTLSASEVTRKTEPVNPEQLIQMLRDRYGDEFANLLAKDYVPDKQPTHEAGHA